MAEIFFLSAPGVRVIDEVMALMDPDANPSGYDECRELTVIIKQLAAKMPATLKTDPWRKVTGSSGGLYSVYVSETEPYVVYAAVQRETAPHEMFVMHVGMRNARRAALFYREIGAEIDRLIAVQGWLP